MSVQYAIFQLGEHLQERYQKNDFYYLLTGDTQHWHRCTAENEGCLNEALCDFDGTQKQVIECQKRHGEYANRVQQSSMKSLKQFMQTQLGTAPTGVIINGDLTEFGHDEELSRYKEQWSNWAEFKVYPGLGNHDYANNVNDCTFQHCANRMLKFFKSYVKDTLKLPIDVRGGYKNIFQQSHTGSFAYSWDECPTNDTCFHFIQLNNYPTYTRNIDSVTMEWKIMASLNFLKHDLQANVDKMIVINFHDFDTGFNENDKRQFLGILKSNPQFKILAIFFAHFHDRHGIRGYWCINGRSVPLMYTGSVPANNYLLVQFSQESKSLKTAYKIHAVSEDISNVEEVYFQDSCKI